MKTRLHLLPTAEWGVQDGFSPVFFQAATVRVQGSDFVNNAGGPAIKLSGGSSLDLLAVLFGSGGDANELGDIAVSGGQVYAGLGFVGDGVCSNDRGCTF